MRGGRRYRRGSSDGNCARVVAAGAKLSSAMHGEQRPLGERPSKAIRIEPQRKSPRRWYGARLRVSGLRGQARRVACPRSAGNGSMHPVLRENAYVGPQSRAAWAVCRGVQKENLEALGLGGHREPWRGHCRRLGLWCLAAIPVVAKRGQCSLQKRRILRTGRRCRLYPEG